jgi:hypothetical protein
MYRGRVDRGGAFGNDTHGVVKKIVETNIFVFVLRIKNKFRQEKTKPEDK